MISIPLSGEAARGIGDESGAGGEIVGGVGGPLYRLDPPHQAAG